MWGNAKNPKPAKQSAKIDTLIGQNTEVRGDIVFSGGLHVDGIVRGNVIAEEGSGSLLTLSERGQIEGDVKVPNVVLNGTIVGDVHAPGHIELAAQARVNGNVYYSLIEMAMGAEVNGNLVHRSEAADSVVALKRNGNSSEPKTSETADS
ncbi:MAG: polymer-forming cytoskeletal protein [Pseudomonadota bacterium]|nr:MAG: polymer-forming cytoskeletal protein [Pseudomonadota bacterium]